MNAFTKHYRWTPHYSYTMEAKFITVIDSKAKGKRGELLAVKLMNDLGFKNPRRGLSQSAGAIEADVVSDSSKGYWLEVKNCLAGSCIYGYLEQAERDSKNTPKIPLVMYKSNNKKFVIIGDAELLLPILCSNDTNDTIN